jgi:hypothetical protein
MKYMVGHHYGALQWFPVPLFKQARCRMHAENQNQRHAGHLNARRAENKFYGAHEIKINRKPRSLDL